MTDNQLQRVPRPQSDAEFAILTDWYFGRPLHLRTLTCYGNACTYEIEEEYNSYHGAGWEFSEGSICGYDHSRVFLQAVFGRLVCGGTARASYGQAKTHGHRHVRRLRRWICDRRRGTTDNSVRPAFLRLAEQTRARREHADASCGVSFGRRK
jgi:hypothetical protein